MVKPVASPGGGLQVLETAPSDVWDRAANSDPAATVFHTRGWAENACRSHANAAIATRAFVLEDGALAVLPLLKRRFGIFTTLLSAPDGIFGGAIAERPLRDVETAAILASVPAGPFTRVVINGNPYGEIEHTGQGEKRLRYTQSVDLTRGFDLVFAGFHTTCRRNVRIGRRHGLQVVAASSADDYSAYFAAHQQAVKRLVRPADYLKSRDRLFRLRDDLGDAFRLWLVILQGRTLGGMCVLYHRERAYYWHGAYLEDAFNYRGPNFLLSEVIRDACNRGMRDLDLGTSNSEGVVRFKEGFGAKRLYFDELVLSDSTAFKTALRVRDLIRRR